MFRSLRPKLAALLVEYDDLPQDSQGYIGGKAVETKALELVEQLDDVLEQDPFCPHPTIDNLNCTSPIPLPGPLGKYSVAQIKLQRARAEGFALQTRWAALKAVEHSAFVDRAALRGELRVLEGQMENLEPTVRELEQKCVALADLVAKDARSAIGPEAELQAKADAANPQWIRKAAGRT